MAYTLQSSLDFAKTAYELMAYFSLRPELYFEALADVKPVNQSMVGSSVQWNIVADLSAATTSLNESTDVTPAVLSDSTVSVSLAEYGNAVITTALGRGTSFVDLDELVQNVVGYNAGISIDTLVSKGILAAGTNVSYSTGSGPAPAGRSSIIPTNTFGATDIRSTVAALRRGNVPAIGGYYLAFIHPDVQFDLQAQTGTNTWSDPHAYSDPADIWNGEIGAFQGARFIATPRAPIFADAGSSTTNTDVYRTMFVGKQALAKAWSAVDGNTMFPRVVPGPVTDSLRRFVPLGWYWLGGYAIFRQASIWGVESASSIGLNGSTGSH